jgi:transposase
MQRSYVNSEGREVHLPYGFHLTNVMEPIREFFDTFDRPPLSVEARKRFQWIDYHKRGHTVSLTCRHFGIPRKTFYLWLKRYEESGTAGLEDLDRTPKRKRQRKCTPLQEERIVALRTKYIRYGKEKLATIYMREHGESITSWQIQKVIEKYKIYYNPKKVKRTATKRKKSLNKKRITMLKKKPKTGFLICVDSIVIY